MGEATRSKNAARVRTARHGNHPTPGSAPATTAAQREWQRAITDPEVWARLEFHAGRIGSVPPAKLLLAMLFAWDNQGPFEREDDILAAMGVIELDAFGFSPRDIMGRGKPVENGTAPVRGGRDAG